MNHRIGRVVFGLVVGLAVAMYSYRWITNPEMPAERAQQEQAVAASRVLLRSIVTTDGSMADTLEIVDPLAPDRKVGKVYVYAEGPGWAVSGHYRRNDADHWHPYLLTMTESLELVRLKVKDASLKSRAASDTRLEILP